MDARIRAWWAAKQGLDGSLRGASAHDVLARTGWMRSVGGAGPYLGLFARAGLSREAVDREVAELRICELPSARGCTYVVPACDFAIALAAGQGHGDAAQIQVAKKHLGVTDAEIDRLCDAIVDALAGGPLDPRALKEALGDRVRHLGDAGKKRGVTTTLPLGLGRLQGQGRIRRIPANGRLDQQRFSYTVWDPSPLAGGAPDPQALAIELARRFFRWIGPATVDQLAWWSGSGKKAARDAAAEAGAVPLGDGPQLVLREDREALGAFAVPSAPDVRLVGSLDNLAHLRREVAPLVDPAHGEVAVVGTGFTSGTAAARPVSTVLDLPHHAIVDRGELVGLWDYDPAAGEIAWQVFAAGVDAAAAVAETARFVREDLGDARAFSLDTPESRGDRLASLRGA